MLENNKIKLCYGCFSDVGLRLMAKKLANCEGAKCYKCGSSDKLSLDENALKYLAYSFFVRGSVVRCLYGAAPVIQFNEHNEGDFIANGKLADDINLLQETLGIGFFYYGPRLWMIGHNEPLKKLTSKNRGSTIDKLLSLYPERILPIGSEFFRLRKDPESPTKYSEYDAPPLSLSGKGRLDSKSNSILYASQDIEICVHECRFNSEDNLYLATLKSQKNLKFIDFTEIIQEEVSEFESFDIAIQMLFLAGKHSYKITRDIAIYAKNAGYDGIIYPSYFSSLRTGAISLETAYGISLRRITSFSNYEKDKIIPNIAIFGHPIKDGRVTVENINLLYMNKVSYDFGFGPAIT